ncbi:phosphoribosylformimino-5-aminoimidazole carboxamide ribotide isomerase [Eubacterium xylanophilum]|uniref:phosphoribosylformimino-5-aminoimidazole carboxamide ribotide isomerase n=1 Tax=Eubacterium xylanophilum TaxID=39497 RepID=UPI00047AB4D8|nr:phosphoribosylformimino-5-aminoimidazole carboxamide ribotide isomerase [Eubacterium xylanophilum]
MKFRPCIDIHNGKVKQIVGGSLKDEGDVALDNYVSELQGADYARLYKERGLIGGHAIILNPVGSEYYDKDVEQARGALEEFSGGLQIGGGINSSNAERFIDYGASHVIVTSYVFVDGKIYRDRLHEMISAVGKEHLVLDLSCKKRDDKYYIVTDRWQKFTEQPLDRELMEELADSCSEFLVHAVGVEGSKSGIDGELVSLLSENISLPITYAGGIGSYEDIEEIDRLSDGKLDFTVGSALDLFGGTLEFEKLAARYK